VARHKTNGIKQGILRPASSVEDKEEEQDCRQPEKDVHQDPLPG
jgi:hypothetical protein